MTLTEAQTTKGAAMSEGADMPELKPCPWPTCFKFDKPRIETQGMLKMVECPTCLMRGPLYSTEHEAAAAWNELPREQEGGSYAPV